MASVLNEYDTWENPNSASPVTDSVTISSGTNRKLIVFTGGEEGNQGTTIDSVSFNGTSMTQVGSQVNADSGGSFRNLITAWYLNDTDIPTGGSYTLSISYSGSTGNFDYLHWCVYVFDDADQGGFTTSEYDTQTGASTNSITYSTGVSVANGDYVAHAGNVGSGNRTFTCTGYTKDAENNMSGASYYAFSKAITGSGTEAPTTTCSSSEARINGFLVNVKDYVAGGVSAIPPRLQNLENQFSAIIASGLNGVLQ